MEADQYPQPGDKARGKRRETRSNSPDVSQEPTRSTSNAGRRPYAYPPVPFLRPPVPHAFPLAPYGLPPAIHAVPWTEPKFIVYRADPGYRTHADDPDTARFNPDSLAAVSDTIHPNLLALNEFRFNISEDLKWEISAEDTFKIRYKLLAPESLLKVEKAATSQSDAFDSLAIDISHHHYIKDVEIFVPLNVLDWTSADMLFAFYATTARTWKIPKALRWRTVVECYRFGMMVKRGSKKMAVHDGNWWRLFNSRQLGYTSDQFTMYVVEVLPAGKNGQWDTRGLNTALQSAGRV